ncbi:hypothetical protein MNBD_GAMMA05-2641 [hydrothermal vent metagenome]|uniref:Uncharacterized protein n=1 Tax=hydrothermal vent metagenome TaxID=652676 RepID=A0A3B0WED5_9ZZZZ
MNKCKLTATALAVSVVTFTGNVIAHSGNSAAGTPVCLESNIMMADAQNAPFANSGPVVDGIIRSGPGRLLEMNTTTGERGITVVNPLNAGNAGTEICPDHVSCPGPWKPTGNTSGGLDGHAFLTSAAQHALTVHHRDGTPIKTNPVWPTSPSPEGGGFGFVPRILGNGFMPNGNIAQTVCDANFFNASNSDVMGLGESGINYNAPPGTAVGPSDNSSYLFFPPVYSPQERAKNGRVLVLDQESMAAIDEYSKPKWGPYRHDPRWNCPAGVLISSEGLFISMFHGDAVFVVDWMHGIDKHSRGVGSNTPFKPWRPFKLDRKKNRSKVIRVIDLANDGTGDTDNPLNYYDAPYYDSPKRRDNLRAIRMSEDGSLFGTRRSRSRDCLRGEAPGASGVAGAGAPCNPSVFRQHIFVVDPGENHRTGSLALDPGVNVIAGVSINRISGPGCEFINPGHADLDACDVETLYVGVSAGNAGCDADGDGQPGPGHPANQCFKPGGTVYEYLIDKAHQDGGVLAGDGSGNCNGDPNDPAGNTGCAMPIAQFDFVNRTGTSSLPIGAIEGLDPRMVMHIHEAYNQ